MNLVFTNNHDEQGIYFVLYGLTLVVLLLVFGLALDGGNLYLTQLRLQRAVDAGALSGAQLLQGVHETTDVPDPENDFANIQAATARFVKQTFALSTGGAQQIVGLSVEQGSKSLDPGIGSLTSTSPDEQPTLRVSAQVDAHLLLLGGIPWMEKFQTVRANAVATVGSNKVFTVLLIDTSDSMNCNKTSPQYDPTTCRIVNLQKTVYKFLDEQIMTGDYISVITFDAFAQMLVSPKPILVNRTTKQEIKDEISKLWVWSDENNPGAGAREEKLHFNTNIYDGLRLALKQIEENDSRWVNISRNIALFTDGAPSIGWQECQWQAQQQPYAAFNSQVNAIRLPDPAVSPDDCRGDPLCQQLILFAGTINHYLAPKEAINPDRPSQLSDGCPLPTIAPGTLTPPDLPAQLIEDLNKTPVHASDPVDPESSKGRWLSFKADARPDHCDDRTDNWSPNDMYHAAINIADRARLKGILIYTFALGQDASLVDSFLSHSVEDDPYQGGYVGAAFDIVQTNFLRRLANDPGFNPDETMLSRLNFDGPCVKRYPSPPFDATNMAVPPEINAYRRGRFFDATWADSSDPTNVRSGLDRLSKGSGTMARIMRARLIQ